MAFESIKQILKETDKKKKPVWEVILENDLKEHGVKREDSIGQMRMLWASMKAAGGQYDGDRRSLSGLSGGDGAKMAAFLEKGRPIGGDFVGRVICEALKMGESNACMKRIVAAPTAGSCGVIPAVLLPLCREESIDDDTVLQALYVAAGFGQVIAARASISGSEGGCQAEIGTASAMAAAALVSVRGGTPFMCAQACAFALKSLMGLVCDPVAGLVEVPCVKRNVVGAMNAVSSANMALAGIESRIPPDEVIDAMRAVGDTMPVDLKETGRGGLAKTPTGAAIAKKLTRPAGL